MLCFSFDWNDLTSHADFIGAAFGAFLGFFLALLLLLLERWITWVQKRADQRLFSQDILTIVEKECKTATDVAKHYSKMSEAYKSRPHEMQPRPIHVNVGLRTLDRLDRQVTLAAFRRIAGRDKGWELWRETLHFIDGLGTLYPYQETAILSSMEDMAKVAENYDKHLREVHLWAATIGSELRAENHNGQPLGVTISDILNKVQDVGFIPMSELHNLLIIPLGELFKSGVLNLRNALPLAEAIAKARSSFGRYGEITKELAQNLDRFSNDMNETATEGGLLRERIRSALN